MAGQRLVTSDIIRPDGTPWSNAEVRFQLLDDTFVLSPAATYPTQPFVAIADADGYLQVTLASGLDQLFLVTLPDGSTFYIAVPDGGDTTLELLRSAYTGETPAPVVTIETIVDAAIDDEISDALAIVAATYLTTAIAAATYLTTAAAAATYLTPATAASTYAALAGAIFTGQVKSSSPTAGIGYATGAGGTATQSSNKTTGVTLNTICGQITLAAGALAANTTTSFVLTDSAIALGDVLLINHISGGTVGTYKFDAASAAGSATIFVRNVTGGSLNEQPVIRFVVFKAVTA